MNPDFPAEVVSNPICWVVVAKNIQTPKIRPPNIVSLLNGIISFPSFFLMRSMIIMMIIRKNAPIDSLIALYAIDVIDLTATLWKTKAVPQITEAMSNTNVPNTDLFFPLMSLF